MRATLARQSGSRKPLLRPRRTTQRTVVIGARPALLLPQNGLLASTSCAFSTTCVFAYVCSFRRSVVIRVRPALSFHQNGLLASTACTFLQRLIFIMFGRCQNTCAPLRREAHFGRLGCLLEAPGPPREASRPPKAPQRHSKDVVWVVWLSLGSPRAPVGRPPGPQRHPKVAPGTGQ